MTSSTNVNPLQHIILKYGERHFLPVCYQEITMEEKYLYIISPGVGHVLKTVGLNISLCLTNEVCPDIGPLSVAGSDFKQVEITDGYCGRVAHTIVNMADAIDSGSNLQIRAFLLLKMLENSVKRRRLQTVLAYFAATRRKVI
ncbi:hypothetical protein pdam_00014638, partial [Pocillopora damicornis]